MISLKKMITETLQIPDYNQEGNIMASLKNVSKLVLFSQVKTTPEEVADWYVSNKKLIKKAVIAPMAGENVFYVLTWRVSHPMVIILAFGELSYIHKALSIIKSKLPPAKPRDTQPRVQYVDR